MLLHLGGGVEKKHWPVFSPCIFWFCLKPPCGEVSILLLVGEGQGGEDRDLSPVSLPKHLQGKQLCSLGLMAQKLGVSHAAHSSIRVSCMHTHTCIYSPTYMHVYLQKNMQATFCQLLGSILRGCVRWHFLFLLLAWEL